MKIKRLDELQLIKRGNIFKHCFFTVIGLLFVNMALLELDIAIMNQRDMMLCVILLVVSLFCIEMIICDIYPIGESKMRVLYCISGLFSLALAAACIYEIFIQKMALYEYGHVSSTGTGIIISIFLLSIPVTYFTRMLRQKENVK